MTTQAFRTSEDTGELIGIARVLTYPARPSPLYEPPRAITERANKAPRADLTPLPMVVQDGIASFPEHPKWGPVPMRFGARELQYVGRSSAKREPMAIVRCDCGATIRMTLSIWRQQRHKNCARCAKQAVKSTEFGGTIQERVARDGRDAMRAAWTKTAKATLMPTTKYGRGRR
jgi:hypothetical protein